jgi:hypothetical protein
VHLQQRAGQHEDRLAHDGAEDEQVAQQRPRSTCPEAAARRVEGEDADDGKRYRSGAGGPSPAARFTWSASLQNAQTVEVVT